jgi:hypothetical protein
MIHIRVDDEIENSKRRFACGIGPALPAGDVYFHCMESQAQRADCPGCNPGGPQPFGTPLSEVSGRPGTKGYGEFVRIAESWGYP